MIFHEIYSCYYNVISEIIKKAIKSNLSKEDIKEIVNNNAFNESFPIIYNDLKKGKYIVVDSNFNTIIKHISKRPLSLLEKRWLKSISLDNRINIFNCNTDFLENIKPLFTPDDYYIFDKYNDGDYFNSDEYINIFNNILYAIDNDRKIQIFYKSEKGNKINTICSPFKIEYSEKDDKFRLFVCGSKFGNVFNIGRIYGCKVLDTKRVINKHSYDNKKYFIIQTSKRRNALERVLVSFANFEKEAERIENNLYKVKIYYYENDEAEIIMRVISFGPLIKVIEPFDFINLIKKRLIMQKRYI